MLRSLTTLSIAFMLAACGDKEAEDTSTEAEEAVEEEVSEPAEEESSGEFEEETEGGEE